MTSNEHQKVRKAIGTQLRDAREKARLTQAEVAEVAKLNPNYYARIERGNTMPALMTLARILKVLGIKSSAVLPF